MAINKVCAGVALLGLFVSGSVLAHGYISEPASRAYLCNETVNKQCGEVQYEPQSLEGPKGFPQGGPADGHIASAGKSQFHELDAQTVDRWAKVPVTTGEMTFTWTLTMAHSTESWDYYITKPGWDSSKPLSRADFDLTPFCHVDGNGKVPVSPVKQKCTLPAGHEGYNVILGVWSIADTGNAFYQAVDVDVQ